MSSCQISPVVCGDFVGGLALARVVVGARGLAGFFVMPVGMGLGVSVGFGLGLTIGLGLGVTVGLVGFFSIGSELLFEVFVFKDKIQFMIVETEIKS
jgi:hypothetical protein